MKTPDLKVASSFPQPFMIRKSMYAFCFSLSLVGFSIFFIFNNYNNSSTTRIWVNSDYRSQFSTLLSHFFPLSSSSYPDDFIARSPNGYPSIDQKHDGLSEIEEKTDKNWAESKYKQCDLYNGSWVRDESYPLYEAGSCPFIDEQFNCLMNGRTEKKYESFRWQPNDCKIPRLNGTKLLEFLRGKRLVYVGDSLNRNMWESMVCILRSSVKNKTNVFEASNRDDFRAENSYSFIFEDYNCSVEFYRTSFLVQQWETYDNSGLKKSTLRLDTVDGFYERFKTADILVFNTGHWWTRGRTSRGKGYFQEGSQIYSKLNVQEAFRRAMVTWAGWVDANVDPTKTQVFFRSYSPSHFRKGQWNSGGQCDSEVEPITDDKYLSEYPQKMKVVEEVMKGMKTPVLYLNITRMTDYRKDAHPSIFRKHKNVSTEDEKMSSALVPQDCSHWCLPGVPDTWNEILYAHILKNR